MAHHLTIVTLARNAWMLWNGWAASLSGQVGWRNFGWMKLKDVISG